ncbi:MAG: hypothetical protein JW779_14400 [Candidatus Thorarchaeota archaeon]|nr:hypothetical protein [Candidatus Thorarchaeota archaeon]
MGETETQTKELPPKVKITSYFILAEVIAGLIIAGYGLYLWGNWENGIGLVMAIIGIWVYFRFIKLDPQAWTIAFIFNIAAAVLYAIGENWPGVILSVLVIFFLLMPDVKSHFGQ